jgi:hypothetical protein
VSYLNDSSTLLDEQLPVDLAEVLIGHTVDTVAGRGWAGVKNGVRRI